MAIQRSYSTLLLLIEHLPEYVLSGGTIETDISYQYGTPFD